MQDSKTAKAIDNENTHSDVKKYKSYRIIDGKPRWVIVDENGKIIDRDPSKEELKGIKKELREPYDTNKYTKEELLNELRRFAKEEGRPPTKEDFTNNPGYPNFRPYQSIFGRWSNALKLVRLDAESMINLGILETSQQKLDWLK